MRSRVFATLCALVLALPALHASVLYSFTGADAFVGTTFQVNSANYLQIVNQNDLTNAVPKAGQLIIGGSSYGSLTSVSFGFFTYPITTTGLGFSTFVDGTGAATSINFAYNIGQDGVYSGTYGTLTIQSTPAVTPEPSSLLLLGNGLFGAVAALRRRTSNTFNEQAIQEFPCR